MEEAKFTVPKHVAIILDGNGRWAKKRGLPRTMGHREGCKTVEKMIWEAGELGIGYLTLYGFSTENWKRDKDEVSALMQLFRIYAVKLLKIAGENNVRVRVIGDRQRFEQDIIESLDRLEAETKENTGLTLVMAVNYGARDEMRRAVIKMTEAVKENRLAPDDITEKTISDYLDTAGMPDPDLLIRTGGEMRLSNYLLYQCAYTELYVTDVLWPDFNRDELIKAIESFNKRERRFGGVIQK